MKHFLYILFVLFSLSAIGQTKFLYNSVDKYDLYQPNDSILYFEFKDTCQLSEIGYFIDSLSNNYFNIDTIYGNLYRVRYHSNQKDTILNLFENKNCFKFFSNGYIDKDSMIVWPSNSLLIKVKMNENTDSVFQNLNNKFTVLRVDSRVE